VLIDEDMVQLGAVAKCAPPLRPRPIREALWERLEKISTIGSDHSPAPPSMKTDSNFFKVWGGISGVQHTLPLLISEGHHQRATSLPLLARLTSSNVAERFKLPEAKGRMAVGSDADLALVDLKDSFEILARDLLCRHAQSPYVGRRLTARVVQTILRGQTVFRNGQIVSQPIGRLITPRK